MNDEQDRADEVGSRGPELAVALMLAAAGVLVVLDSLRVGIGWADDGPRAGYFPFYIGLALLGASGWVAVQQLLRWRAKNAVFADKAQLRMVWAILWPMVIYVGLVATLGLYVASFVLIGYFMRRHGKHGALVTVVVSLGVPLACFAVFERWFLVALPKGPLEAMLGL